MKRKGKGILIVAILAMVAVVLAVVFVLLFKDRNTEALAEKLDTYVTSGYLCVDEKDTEDKLISSKIENYIAEIGTIDDDDEIEADNLYNTYLAYVKIAKFFNKEVAFFDYTSAYKKNASAISKSLASAQTNAETFVSKCEDYSSVIGTSGTWRQTVWTNEKIYFENMINDTISAFDKLMTVYAESAKSNYLSNDLSDLMFLGIRTHASYIQQNGKQTENIGSAFLSFATANKFDSTLDHSLIEYIHETETIKNEITEAIADITENGRGSTYFASLNAGNML